MPVRPATEEDAVGGLGDVERAEPPAWGLGTTAASATTTTTTSSQLGDKIIQSQARYKIKKSNNQADLSELGEGGRWATTEATAGP